VTPDSIAGDVSETCQRLEPAVLDFGRTKASDKKKPNSKNSEVLAGAGEEAVSAAGGFGGAEAGYGAVNLAITTSGAWILLLLHNRGVQSNAVTDCTATIGLSHTEVRFRSSLLV
jgi:hypothetical protein